MNEAEAIAMIEASSAAPIAAIEETAPAAIEPETPPAVTPPAQADTVVAAVEGTPPARTKLAPKDDDEVDVMVDGKAVTMSWKDAKAGFMRAADYTRKTQALATDRTATETLRTELGTREQRLAAGEQEIISILKDPAKFQAAWMAVNAGVATPGQAAAVNAGTSGAPDAATLKAEVDKQARAIVAEALAARDRQDVERSLSADLDGAIKALLSDKPGVAAFPSIESYLINTVFSMQPKSMAEAKQQMATVIDAITEAQQKAFEAHAKASAVKRGKASTEPVGGKGVVPAPKDITSMTDAEFEASMVQFVREHAA